MVPFPTSLLPSLSHCALLPSRVPPFSRTSPLPVASDNLCAGSEREKSRTSLAAAPPDLSLAAEPLGDNFDGHNDAGGNHFNEDQSSLKAVERLLPRLRATVLGPPTSVRVHLPAAQGERSTTAGRIKGGQRDKTGRSACELPARRRDPGNLGASLGSCIPASPPTQTPTQTPPFPPCRHTQNLRGVLGANPRSICPSLCWRFPFNLGPIGGVRNVRGDEV